MGYCTIQDIRDEGFGDPPYPDTRVQSLIDLATQFVDKMTGRWFEPRVFDVNNPFLVDGKGGFHLGDWGGGGGTRQLHLEIPIISIDKLSIETQGFLNPDLIEITPDNYRVYNRHLSGMTQPDDREDPRIAFIPRRIVETVASGLFPAPLAFPPGRQNIFLEGTFGYTDPDGTALGKTPDLIRRATCLLVQRDLRLDSDACEKLAVKTRFRIVMDKEGKNTVRLQDLWLKGAFTGDPEIDNILMAYKRPPRIGVA